MESLNDPIWLDHLRSSIGEERGKILLEALASESSVSVRLNPFKSVVPEFDCDIRDVEWNPYGRILSRRPCFTLDPLFHAGVYYVQDSSSMYVGHVLRSIIESEGKATGKFTVLDLCAAPGGKTTDFAASLRERFGDGFLLVSNEVIRSRASTLSDNVSLWGDPNVIVTSADPRAFSCFEACFDLILTDVPCSGEGMFRKDRNAVRDWSENLVDLCCSRQRRILGDVWPSLKKDGLLIYSTCTFEQSENDGNVKWICENLGAEPVFDGGPSLYGGVAATEMGHILIPGMISGEGQYVSAVRKTGGTSSRARSESAFERMRLRPREEDSVFSLNFDRTACPEWELDLKTALSYLHGDSFRLPVEAGKGVLLMTYKGLPLGYVKNLGSRCNNLYPKGRRIMMDINKCV